MSLQVTRACTRASTRGTDRTSTGETAGQLDVPSNRRQFLRLAVGVASGAILAACGTAPDASEPRITVAPVLPVSTVLVTTPEASESGALTSTPTPAISPTTIVPSTAPSQTPSPAVPTPRATERIAVPTVALPARPPVSGAPTTSTIMAGSVPGVPAPPVPPVPPVPPGQRPLAPQGATDLQPLPGVIPPTFFGMHIHRAATTTPWPVVPFGVWRLWDAQVAWFNLEPRREEWHFETLDRYVALAEEHGVEILLPLGFSPAWASARPDEVSPFYPLGASAEPQRLEDWQQYVSTVATRYKGRIRYYEVWNEPNLRQYWTGSTKQLISLTQTAYWTLKAIDPSVTMVGPSVTSHETGLAWLSDYLAKGGGASLDVIAHHFYVFPGPPEALVPFMDSVRQILMKYGVRDKPLWNTEITWALPATFATPADAAAYLARTYLLNWGAGAERCYWYAWDNHAWATLWLTEMDGKTPTPAGIAYGEVQTWMVGAEMRSCTVDRANTYVCQLVRGENASEWVLWNPSQTLSYPLPDAWHISRTRNLAGSVTELHGETQVPVGPLPLLLQA